MTEPTAFEKNTPAIPGTEGMAHQHSYERVQSYPVVKDTLAQAYTLVQSNAYSNALYDRATTLALSILQRLEPLQNRLPLERVDGYANQTLDYVEKRFPQVKADTADLYKTARQPADQAAGIAKAYADSFQLRIAQGQETLQALQERLHSTIAAVPHDKQSATDAIHSVMREAESLSAYITTNVKELPATAQAKAQPLIDGLTEATAHIKAEIVKADTPISQKATNILKYSQEQLTPLLTSIKDLVTKKKAEVAAEADKQAPTVNGH